MARILIVDDDGDVRETIGSLVRLDGHDPLMPLHGAVAASIKAGFYDLVITDIIMPEMDGIEIVKLVREVNPGCPILAISGGSRNLPSEMTLHLIEKLGADASLRKPFTRAQLQASIAALLHGKS